MKIKSHGENRGEGRVLVFYIPEKPEAGELVIAAAGITSGKKIEAQVKAFADQHGAEI